MNVNSQGFLLPAVRDGHLLRRLKGSCVETCLQQVAVAKQRGTLLEQQIQYRHKVEDSVRICFHNLTRCYHVLESASLWVLACHVTEHVRILVQCSNTCSLCHYDIELTIV